MAAGLEILRTERLRLRLLTEDDAEFYLALINQPAWIRYISDKGVRTVDGARQLLVDGAMAHQRAHGYSFYAVELTSLPAGSPPIGICGLLRREGMSGTEIGYAMMQAHWGRGYVQEAARGVLAHARDVLGLPRLMAITAPDNAASIKILLNLGMVFQEVIDVPPYDTSNLYLIEFPQEAGD